MRSRILLAVGLATALGGVPSFASAADGTVPEQGPLDGSAVPIVVGAAAISLAGIVMLVTRRRGPRGELAATAAERAIEAADDEVTAALQRRTLRRGRMRVDDEQAGPVQPIAPRRRIG